MPASTYIGDKTYSGTAEDDERYAKDQYDSFGRKVLADVDEYGRKRTAAGTTADRAYDSYTAPRKSNVGAYNADALRQYQPAQVAQWMSSFSGRSGAAGGSRAPRGSTGMIASGGGGAGAPGGGANFSSELQHFDPSALTDFDPTAYGEKFAEGAYGDFKRNFDDELEDLTNSSVGAGRFRTGLFDEDRGRVATRLGKQFTDRIAQESSVFSGQRLSALQGGTELGFRRASDMDANRRAIAELNATLGFNREELASRESIAAGERDLGYDRLALDEFSADTDRERLGFTAASDLDERNYRRAADLDRLDFERASNLDEMDERRGHTGLDAALARERGSSSDYFNSVDRGSEYVSGARDWAARDRELADLRKQIEELKKARQGNPGVGVPFSDPNEAAARKIAASYGVPFTR